MTIKEAILKSLDDINGIAKTADIYNHIVRKRYYDFGAAKTPAQTVSALLGDFIRKGDTRVKRVKQTGGTYSYYLTKNEHNIGMDVLTGVTESTTVTEMANATLKKVDITKTYDERDLHKLLTTFLKSKNIDSKTMFHEKSSNSKDKHQKWIHPDMLGIAFSKLQTPAS